MGCAYGVAIGTREMYRMLDQPIDGLCCPVHWVAQRADQCKYIAPMQITRLCKRSLIHMVPCMVRVSRCIIGKSYGQSMFNDPPVDAPVESHGAALN